jgi:hypothetical protein
MMGTIESTIKQPISRHDGNRMRTGGPDSGLRENDGRNKSPAAIALLRLQG